MQHHMIQYNLTYYQLANTSYKATAPTARRSRRWTRGGCGRRPSCSSAPRAT